MKIFKYTIGRFGYREIQHPVGANILAVQVQGDNIVFWAEVKEDANNVVSGFCVLPTGAEVVEDQFFLKTVQFEDGLVGHVYIVPATLTTLKGKPLR